MFDELNTMEVYTLRNGMYAVLQLDMSNVCISQENKVNTMTFVLENQTKTPKNLN